MSYRDERRQKDARVVIIRPLTEEQQATMALHVLNNKSEEELARLEAEAQARLTIANEVVREAQREKNTMQAEARARIRVFRKAAQDSTARRTDKLNRRAADLVLREAQVKREVASTQRLHEKLMVTADRAGAKYADAQAQVDQALSLMVEVKARQVRVADVQAEAQALNDAAEASRQRTAKEARRIAIEWEQLAKQVKSQAADTFEFDRKQRILDEEIERARSTQRAFEDQQRETEDDRVTLTREKKEFKIEQESQAAGRVDIKDRLREIHDREDAVSRRERIVTKRERREETD